MSVLQRELFRNIQKNRIKKQRFFVLLAVLSVLIFTGVVWELRIEGISMTDDVRCDTEAHRHLPACYDHRLICGLQEDQQEDQEHTHTADCYEEVLICGQQEHTHSMSCYVDEAGPEETDIGAGKNQEVSEPAAVTAEGSTDTGGEAESTEGSTDTGGEAESAEGSTDTGGEAESAEGSADTGGEAETTEGSAGTGGEAETAEGSADTGGEVETAEGSTDTGGETPESDLSEEDMAWFFEELSERLGIPAEELAAMTEDELQTLYEQWLADNGYESASSFALPPAEKQTFMVVTSLGERPADRIHEWLPGIGLMQDPERDDISTGYLVNSETNPYILHEGDTITVCVYGDPDARNGSNKYYIWNFSEEQAVVKVSNGADTTVDGYRRQEATLTAVGVGTSTIYYSEYSPALKFYVKVVPSVDDKGQPTKYDHADIEVLDGGTYWIEESSVMENGDVIKIRTTYQTYIVGVNQCRVYDADDTVIATFYPEDYQENGAPGETQYELTSKYVCMNLWSKHFEQGKAEKAEFDTRILLRPLTREYFRNDVSEGGEQPISGESDLYVPNAIFSPSHLNITSVIDANNKCPNHSGLDFTVQDKLNVYFTIPPAAVEFRVDKVLLGDTLTAGQFEFELVDAWGMVVATAKNQADGSIVFPKQYFLVDKTYTYTIREKIPDAAMTLPDGRQYYNGYVYDTSQKTVSVEVELSADHKSLIPKGQSYVEPFQNEKYTLPTGSVYGELKVSKTWSAGDHSADSIRFTLQQSVSGTTVPFSYGGSSEFVLSQSNNWTMTFQNVEVMRDGQRVTYSATENPVPEGYTPVYSVSPDGMSITIQNKRTGTPISLSVKKDWRDENNNVMASPPQDSVTVLLRRQSHEIEVPVTVRVEDSQGNQKTLEFLSDQPKAYLGSSFTFTLTLEDQANTGNKRNEKVKSATNCSCVMSGSSGRTTTFVVSDIRENAEIVIQCDEALKQGFSEGSGYFVHETFGADTIPEGWTVRRGNATTTLERASGVGYAAAGSLAVRNRTTFWNGINHVYSGLATGQEYSFTAYLSYQDSGMASPAAFDMGLYYKAGGGDVFTNLVSATAKNGGEWVRLSCPKFVVPASEVTRTFYFQTEETGGTFHDFYLDDFIVAPYGIETELDRSDGAVLRANATYQYSLVNKDIPADVQKKATTWLPDTTGSKEWSKTLALKQADGWMVTLEQSDLDEATHKEYRYYVLESPIPGYTVSYSGDMVAFNTTSTPITVTNRLISYRLPATGGVGARNVRFLGLITLTGSCLAGAYIKKRKRRSSA